MAGHSQFANIKHRKNAQDAKKAKVFTRLVRELTVATKESGPDIEFNPRLRLAIIMARAANMPKDRIDNAISKGSSNNEGDNFELIKYEGYGPGSVAIIVEALTDNRNRTASNIRAIFNKYGGSFGESGSVAFLFDHLGMIRFSKSIASDDEIFESGLLAGAESIESNEEEHLILTSIADFAKIRDDLIAKYGDPISVSLEYLPKNLLEIDEAKREILQKMLDALDDDEDVQNVYHNNAS